MHCSYFTVFPRAFCLCVSTALSSATSEIGRSILKHGGGFRASTHVACSKMVAGEGGGAFGDVVSHGFARTPLSSSPTQA
eukprot:m.9581 g.9581  ORF g.9581 m.9581 type:complete len:80 (-) comp5442_c0_seq1:691-930(-)